MTFLTDATGAVTDSYDLDAWGILVATTGSTPNSRLYAGEELDPDLGLLNLRARQYKPGTGRFLTIDPLDAAKGAAPNNRLPADVIATVTQPHFRAILEIAPELSPLNDRLLTPGVLNRYLYANGDSVNGLDPSGRLSATEYAVLQALAQALVSELLADFVPMTDTQKRCMRWGANFGGGAIGVVVGKLTGFVYWMYMTLLCYLGGLPW